MGLFNRSAGAQVTVAPAVVRPRQTVTATVTTDSPVDKVTSATLEWGYTNFYRYRWAGRADSTAVEMNDAWWMMGEVGTDAGSEKDTEDWVGVTKVDLPIATGEFSGATSSFTVPSWAPGSSDALARWSASPHLSSAAAATSIPAATSTWSSAPHDLQVTDEPQLARRLGTARPNSPSCCHRSSFVPASTITGNMRPHAADGHVRLASSESTWAYTTLSHPLEKTPDGRRRLQVR